MERNKAKIAAAERKMLAALTEHFTSSAILTVNGAPYKAKELQSIFKAHIDAATAADALKAKWQTAVATAQAKAAVVAGLLPALRAHVISEYGGASQTAADFGFTPKQRSTTVEAQAAGVAKRAATRLARGTKGKKQREKVVGVVAPAAEATVEAPKVAPAQAVTAS
jgi:hypothetical protein